MKNKKSGSEAQNKQNGSSEAKNVKNSSRKCGSKNCD